MFAEFSTSPLSTASITSLESLLNPPAAIEPLQKFLRFQIDSTQSMLLPVEEIAAVQTLHILDILPVPQMSACILGMSNWRGEALWLVDLSQQLGFKAIAQQADRVTTLSAIVIQSGRKSLGLIVREIDEIEEYNLDNLVIPSPDLFPQSISPFIKGYFTHDRSVVLSGAAILQDPALHVHHLNSL
ncbi:chemotaxis protein CheW [Leptolyngbya sp. NIES-2104]|uniref:chemotaxis protein CheW n=1 Tax=Leptolyngbya sp. NIES-2104 TaxID=1552121 RepID=UPI0006EC4BE2|nr:chemotaxis protein CheW [Leptolyngbya sp. NIES-2104]GAP94538.1 purine-binding chemotaxis protein [Leptolyngbya sp. NIES-2104]